jgi:hypothetical protein
MNSRWNHWFAALVFVGLVSSALTSAQALDVCGNSGSAPDSGPFRLLCNSVQSFIVASNITFTNLNNDGLTQVDWEVHDHGDCAPDGPKQIKCVVTPNGNPDLQFDPRPEGVYSFTIDYPVGFASIVCSCDRWAD